ncbi:MAG: cytochrome c maturation protein CcmE [Gemmatimonadales bacterium]
MKPRTKFIIGAVLVAGAMSVLMASSIRETGVYFLTPSELAAKVAADPTMHNVGVKIGGQVVHGTITRDVATRTITFQITDGDQIYPVVYRGIAPDTFTDDVEVVVEGRLGADGTFRATSLLAKCGSRYEAAPEA